MTRHPFFLVAGLMLVAGSLFMGGSLPAAGQSDRTVSGIVVDEGGSPVPDAVVRIQDTTDMTRTDADGAFVLDLPGAGPYDLTAWASGYYCVGPVEASSGQTGVQLVLVAHSAEDNAGYEWLPSQRHPGQGENQGCSECHSQEGTDITFTLPVDEWRLDAHSQAAVNPRFLTMYAGTGRRREPESRHALRHQPRLWPVSTAPRSNSALLRPRLQTRLPRDCRELRRLPYAGRRRQRALQHRSGPGVRRGD